MRMITSLLLASLIAAGIAGCDDTTDCPAAVAQGTSCTAAGLTCFSGANQCSCSGGQWQCKAPDMTVPDLSVRDMTPPSD
jgi:hypothetical protein